MDKNQIINKLQQHDERFDELEQRMEANFNHLVGMIQALTDIVIDMRDQILDNTRRIDLLDTSHLESKHKQKALSDRLGLIDGAVEYYAKATLPTNFLQ